MANFNSNVLIAIFVGVIVLIAVIYYINKNDDHPIPNQGSITNNSVDNFPINSANNLPIDSANNLPNNFPTNSANNLPNNSMRKLSNDNHRTKNFDYQQINNGRYNNDISDSIVDDLVSQYDVNDINSNSNPRNFSPSDPMAKNYGQFNGYAKKRHINMKKMETPFDENDDDDCSEFTYKKKKFVRRTPSDIKDQFDVDKMLPQEIEDDWFDLPLQNTKKIKGTHMIHPKVHMGINTVGSSLKNGTHDMRGDIPNPKIKNFSPFLNSTIEPDDNIKGFCNSEY